MIGLGRAFAGYLVLFAPLVLFPTVFDEWGLGIARGGLVLTWLPAGFAGMAVLGNLLPGHLTNEHRLTGGAFVTTAAYVALPSPGTRRSPPECSSRSSAPVSDSRSQPTTPA